MQNSPTAKQLPASSKGFLLLFIFAVFLAGFLFRLMVFRQPHEEGDERIYQALVEQLELGRGYTLQGSPILESGTIDRMEYDHPLFFHPPGGILLFWILSKLFGPAGFAVTQLLSYTLFFAGMMWLAQMVVRSDASLALGATAVLAAFTPIAAHVMNHYWLDGPLLAFTTLAAALFVFGTSRGQSRWVLAGGAALGYAALIKVTALFALPGFLLLAWSLRPQMRFARLVRMGFLLLLPVLLLHLPWELWQWKKIGTLFQPHPGKPSSTLVANNLYIHYITAVRSPWVYLTLLPRVLWTLTVSVAAWAGHWKNPRLRRTGAALAGWIVIILVLHIGLGFLGYSKLMRYVILATPASILLFGATVAECRGVWAWGLAAGLILEVAQGIQTSLAKADLIIPLWGGM